MTSAFVETGTFLDQILARTAADVVVRKESTPIADLERRASNRAKPISLNRAISVPGTNVIAEFKRASPSRGRFPVEVEPTIVAAQYLEGGAAAISVLTDEPFFQGSMDDLTSVAFVSQEQNVPVLRKDFILDEYQLVEALAIGADAVLLIVAALEDASLHFLLDKAHEYGLEALVEVHDHLEMRRAIEVGAGIIGVNNRDLRTFEIDIATTERLAPLLPDSTLLVGESGIFTRDDVLRLEQVGADAVLVGESLILSPDRAASIRTLMGEIASD